MPIYEYRCDECESRFEKLVMGSDPEPVSCECGSEAIEKVYSTFAAQSAGDGFEACSTPADERCGTGPCMGGMCSMN